jgi:DsbC/DsbD-like thiol-disulfide interchange protein
MNSEMYARSVCLSVLVFLLSSFASAQQPLARVVAVPVESVMKPGTALTLEVSVHPREGIHIYAPPQKQYIPISISIEPVDGARVGKPRFPRSVVRTFEDEKVRVYERLFSIRVPLVLPRAASKAPVAVAGTVTYQACDDVMCYRPVKVPVRWDLRVE